MCDDWEDWEDFEVKIPVLNSKDLKQIEERKLIEDADILLTNDLFNGNSNTINSNTINGNSTINSNTINDNKEIKKGKLKVFNVKQFFIFCV